jgi:hypothetical protein
MIGMIHFPGRVWVPLHMPVFGMMVSWAIYTLSVHTFKISEHCFRRNRIYEFKVLSLEF